MAIEVGDSKIILEEIHCRFLGKAGDGRYACTVYEKRFEVAPWCHTAEDAAKTGNLSQDCLYASGIPGYNGKHWATPLWRKRLLPIVRKKLIQEGLTLHASPDSALKVLTSEGEDWSFIEEADRFVFRRIDRIVP